MAHHEATEPAEPGEVQPGSGLTVTVAAYHEVQAACCDVRTLCSRAPRGELLDVAFVECTFGEMTAFYGCADSGWGRGVLVSAVCGALWSPSLIVGALAGGVGGRVMTEMRRALSREAITALAGVLENGTFVAVAVSGPPGMAAPRALRNNAEHLATAPIRTSAAALREALDADTAED
jgi:hypothetical protein